jgi:two-component system chemotaxis response regulator CheY
MSHYLNSLYVLLVEPSRSQRRIVLQQFEDLGINQYDTVDTGEEALVRIDTEQPDLVISALFLDDMTGRDLVLEMRDNPVSRDTPFMLISSETSFRELDPVKQAGASAVLPKPFRVEDLKRAINMIMDWDNPEAVELDRDLRILLVDDSKLARRLITRTLNNMGLENITEAEDGRAALPLIQQQEFDLVITDYNMPHMDGQELIWFIRNKSRQPDVPVMMVTTEGDQSKLSAVESQGVAAIIDKPFDAAAVKSLIESMG